MKRSLALTTLVFLLSVSPAFADHPAPPYMELADAPTIAVDWSKGRTQDVTLHANRVITFANAQKGTTYTLIVRQDAPGSRAVTWPSSLRWAGGSAPSLTTTSGKTDFFSIFYDGVNYYGLGLAQNF